MKPKISFEIFKSVNGQYAWRIRHVNGNIEATSETYKNLKDCEDVVYSLTEHVAAGNYRVIKVKK